MVISGYDHPQLKQRMMIVMTRLRWSKNNAHRAIALVRVLALLPLISSSMLCAEEGAGESAYGFIWELGGLIEIEASHHSPYERDSESDVEIATAELGLGVDVKEWLSAELTLLYEEAEANLEIDVATLTLTPPNSPWRITAGQFYLPFGRFETQMVSDPLTLELGETRESALQAGFVTGLAAGSIYLFRGSNSADDDNGIDNWGAELGTEIDSRGVALDASVGYISDLGEADGSEDLVAGTLVPGWFLFAQARYGSLSIIGEYVAAADAFAAHEVNWNGKGARPFTYNIEAGLAFELGHRPTTLALGLQSSDEALGLRLPESRVVAALSVELLPSTSVSFELAREQSYDSDDRTLDPEGKPVAGADERANTFTAQLAVEF